MDPLPTGTTVFPHRILARLQLPSGAALARYSGSLRPRLAGLSLIRQKQNTKQGKAAWLPRLPEEVAVLYALDESQYERYRGVPLVYLARVGFSVQHPQIAELPLGKGLHLGRGSDHTEILSVGRTGGDALTIHLVETSHRLRGEDKTETRFLLVNRSLGEALPGSIDDVSVSSPPLLSGIVPMLEVRRLELDFRSPSDGFEMDAAWLEGAELIRLETSNLGGFSKWLRMEGLVLEQVGPLPPATPIGVDD